MFKSLSSLIHRTPWWGLLLSGTAVLLFLALFAAPLQVMQLTRRADTPEQKRAIQHEINQAFKNSGLGVAEGVLGAMRDAATGQDRRELDKVLAEIARARDEVESGRSDAEEAAREAAREALDSAQEAAQDALEAAQDAVRTVNETRDQTLESLRAKKLDVAETERSFEALVSAAQAKEVAAQVALDRIKQSREKLDEAPPTPPAPAAPSASASGSAAPAGPAVPAVPNAPGIHVQVDAAPAAPAVPPVPPLPPELRDNIRHTVVSNMWRAGVGSALILAFIPLFVLLLIAKYFIDRSHRVLAFAQEKKEEAQVSDMQRQMTEARLQALQAQVEPHFLYNTLANVQALTEIDPPAANKLVGHLIEYLRAALPKMRESSSTVGQEVERVRAYLNILKMRMGERLEFAIHVHDSLFALPFPPMMLPSLVENAIKHGLEPKREGGRIDVLATRVQQGGQERLVLQVKDTGAGLREHEVQSGSGVGLSNLRERLVALYGADARFTIEANQPSGVVSTIDIPAVAPASAPFATTAAPVAGVASPKEPDTSPLLVKGFRRLWGATRKTHGVWAQFLTRAFVVLMLLLVVGFVLGFVGLVTGWIPVQINEFQFDGIGGMALGSLALLIVFGVLALVIGILLLVLYGMGFLFAGLLLFIPAAIVISLFPAMAPFILVGLAVYWFVRRKSKAKAATHSPTETL